MHHGHRMLKIIRCHSQILHGQIEYMTDISYHEERGRGGVGGWEGWSESGNYIVSYMYLLYGRPVRMKMEQSGPGYRTDLFPS
jgi:hypothetical protein